MSIESVMPSNHLILCRRLLLLPSIFPSIRVFSNESVLCIRWPKYWSFNISPSNSYSGMISFRMDWLYLLAVQGTLKNLLSLQLIKINEKKKKRIFSNTTVEKDQWSLVKRVQFSKRGILCQMLQGLCFLCPHVNYRNKISYFFFCSFSFPQVQDRKTILQSFYEDWIWSQI